MGFWFVEGSWRRFTFLLTAAVWASPVTGHQSTIDTTIAHTIPAIVFMNNRETRVLPRPVPAAECAR